MAENEESKSLAQHTRKEMLVVSRPSTRPSRGYGGRFMKAFLSNKLWDFSKGTALNAVTALAFVVFSIYLGATSRQVVKGNVLAIMGTYTVIIGVFLIGNVFRTANLVYREDQAEIERLNKQLSTFTALQLEVLQTAKELSDLLKSNPYHPKTAYGYNRGRKSWEGSFGSRQEYGEECNSVAQKVRAKYAESFQPKAIALYHRLVTEESIDDHDHNLESLVKGEGGREEIEDLVDLLRKTAFTLEDAHL